MMINMFDSNMTGTIDIQEFGKLFTFVNKKKGMFENFDRNKEGTLGQDEFLQALQSMGYRLKQHIKIKNHSIFTSGLHKRLPKILLRDIIRKDGE